MQKLDFYNNVFTTPILDFWLSLFNKKIRSEAISNISYNPKPIIVSDIINLDEEIKKIPSYQSLEEHDIRSFMIIPIVKDGKFLAALEFMKETVPKHLSLLLCFVDIHQVNSL